MADIKFSELSTLAAADVASADVLAVVDTSATASKKLTINNLFGAVPVNIAVVDTTASSSNTTGSITTTGGVGVSGSVVVGTDLTIHGDADIDGTTNLDVVDIDGAVQIDAAVTVGVDDTGHDVKFFGATTGQFLLWDQSADELALVGDTKLSFHDAAGAENIVASADGHLEINAGTTLDITAPTVDINVGTTLNVDGVTQITGAVTIGVDDTGHDVQIFGATADSNILWDESDNALEFGNSFLTITDARTTGTMDVRGLTIDVSNKVDTGSSNDRIGIDVDVIGDVSGNTIRDAVAIRAVSRQSTSAEVTRLNTPIHAVLDMANTAVANNAGTTLSGAYGLAIDHDDTIATRTGQPTAFISFGELYIGGTTSIETAYLFDIFPQGKTGDATYSTAQDVAFYKDSAQYATTRDTLLMEDATDVASRAFITFTVTVATGTNLNGASGNIYYIDGVARPVLALTGNTLYRFDYSDSSVITHIVQFSLTSNGTHGGGAEITKNVTHVGTAGYAGAYVEFLTPNTDATYYYYCGNHSYMGNTINVTAALEQAHRLMMENDPFDSIQMEDNFMIETEDGEAILLETQDNVGTASTILFENGSQDADGVLKIRVNGEDKYIQLYNSPGTATVGGGGGGGGSGY